MTRSPLASSSLVPTAAGAPPCSRGAVTWWVVYTRPKVLLGFWRSPTRRDSVLAIGRHVEARWSGGTGRWRSLEEMYRCADSDLRIGSDVNLVDVGMIREEEPAIT